MIIESIGKKLQIDVSEQMEKQDKKPGDSGYIYPMISQCSSVDIRNIDIPDLLYVKCHRDYTTFEESMFSIRLGNKYDIFLLFEERELALKYLEIFSTNNIDDINLKRDYPELFL